MPNLDNHDDDWLEIGKALISERFGLMLLAHSILYLCLASCALHPSSLDFSHLAVEKFPDERNIPPSSSLSLCAAHTSNSRIELWKVRKDLIFRARLWYLLSNIWPLGDVCNNDNWIAIFQLTRHPKPLDWLSHSFCSSHWTFCLRLTNISKDIPNCTIDKTFTLGHKNTLHCRLQRKQFAQG